MLSTQNRFHKYAHASLPVAMPHILELERVNLLLFSCMKAVPALHMVQSAMARGELSPGGTVIETSSGTFALGLALVCNALDLRCIIVCDPAIDARLERRLTDLGCELSKIRNYSPDGGYQRARLDRVKDLLTRHRGAYWPNQYANPDNPASYTHLADLLVESYGTNIALVASVGSGGSSAGFGKRLQSHDPKIPIIGVDTFGSVIFGNSDSPRLLRGLGNSILPPNVDHTIFKDVHFIDAASAFKATRLLHAQFAVFAGPTTGATWWVARWCAKQFPNRTVVAIGPDDGHRYLDTIYNDTWLTANAPCERVPDSPILAKHLSECEPPWTCLNWNRRRLANVTDGDAIDVT